MDDQTQPSTTPPTDLPNAGLPVVPQAPKEETEEKPMTPPAPMPTPEPTLAPEPEPEVKLPEPPEPVGIPPMPTPAETTPVEMPPAPIPPAPLPPMEEKKEEEKEEVIPAPPATPIKPKKKKNKAVIGGLVAFLLMAGAFGIAMLFPQFRGDIRQRAYVIIGPPPTPTPCRPGDKGCVGPQPTPTATSTPKPPAAPTPTICRPGDKGCVGPQPTPTTTPKPTQTFPTATPTAPPIGGGCPEGQTKCVGNVYYVCDEGSWGVEGSCGATTPTPTPTPRPVEGQICSPSGSSSCSGGVKYVCSGGKWYDAGNCPVAVGPTPTPTLRLTPTSVAGCPEGNTKCEGGWYWVCDENSWNVEGVCGTPTPTTAPVVGGPTTAPADRKGVWGEFGVDCDRSTGVCTGDKVNVYSCDPTQTQTGPVRPDGSGGGPICLQGLQTTSGSVNCVDLANQTCSFIQLDVVTTNPLSGSAMTCYPTNCSPAPTSPPPVDLPTPQTTPGDNPAEVTTTTTTPPLTAACVQTRIYTKGADGQFETTATSLEMLSSKVKVGDTIRLAVRGNLANFTKARFVIKLNGTTVESKESTTTRDLPGDAATFEFIYDYTVSKGGVYSIEGAVMQ